MWNTTQTAHNAYYTTNDLRTDHGNILLAFLLGSQLLTVVRQLNDQTILCVYPVYQFRSMFISQSLRKPYKKQKGRTAIPKSAPGAKAIRWCCVLKLQRCEFWWPESRSMGYLDSIFMSRSAQGMGCKGSDPMMIPVHRMQAMMQVQQTLVQVLWTMVGPWLLWVQIVWEDDWCKVLCRTPTLHKRVSQTEGGLSHMSGDSVILWGFRTNFLGEKEL